MTGNTSLRLDKVEQSVSGSAKPRKWIACVASVSVWFRSKKDRGRGLLVLTAREMKREPKNEREGRIWLAVGNAGSWKRLFLAWLFSWMIRRRRRERSILLSFLLFYGLMVGKYALICAIEIQKIHMVVHNLPGFALFRGTQREYSSKSLKHH